jgi:copper chaperone CopZ
MKKFLTIALLACFTLGANAQIKKATIQASGLTCSMCSNAIYKSLQAVSFIDKVDSDVETSTFEVTFKEEKVDLDALQKAVEKAGFSVSQLYFTMNVSNLAVKNATQVSVDGYNFHFVNVKDKTVSGDVAFKIVDKNFISSKEFKKVKDKLNNNNTQRVFNITL